MIGIFIETKKIIIYVRTDIYKLISYKYYTLKVS